MISRNMYNMLSAITPVHNDFMGFLYIHKKIEQRKHKAIKRGGFYAKYKIR